MNITHSQETIGAVIVTYNPDINKLSKLLSRLSEQVTNIFIIDNNSLNVNTVHTIVRPFNNGEVIVCSENRGLGHAHNLGIQACREAGLKMVLLLDQDSMPAMNMIDVLLGGYNHLVRTKGTIAAVGARYIGNYTNHSSFFVKFRRFRFMKCFCDQQLSDQYIQADMLISSGSLMSIEAINAIGDMDEDLFIDHIDTDWFLRALALGWKSYGICDALMEHSLGENTRRIWVGRWRHIPVHKPFRYYYIYRNSLLLYKRKYASTKWIQGDILRLVFMFPILFCSGPQTLHNLRMISLGLIHGIIGRTGRLDV